MPRLSPHVQGGQQSGRCQGRPGHLLWVVCGMYDSIRVDGEGVTICALRFVVSLQPGQAPNRDKETPGLSGNTTGGQSERALPQGRAEFWTV